MASLHRDTKSPNYSIRFRYDGRNVNRSLGTDDKRRALGICSRVDEMLCLVEGNRIEIPLGIDPIEFILSDGKSTGKAPTRKVLGLTEFFTIYESRLPEGHKELSTLLGERTHLKHFKKHLGPNRKVQAITKSDLQSYVSKRLKDKHHSKPIQPDTIRKELVTFRMLWNWGVQEGLLVGASPTRHVALPLSDEKSPFMTRKEIEAIIERKGIAEVEEKRLWEALYLGSAEVEEVLEYARKYSSYPFIYPMMVFVAHTSARRSEMVRSMVEDIDFRTRTILIREKKKSRTKAMTYRRVDMSPLLYEVMREWISNHPGGKHTFSQKKIAGTIVPLTAWQAQHHFKQTFLKGKWNVLRGFHVFRHSFASNLAAVGIDQRVIDEFMGHQTEEMRRRYRHLFPAQRRKAIEAVFVLTRIDSNRRVSE